MIRPTALTTRRMAASVALLCAAAPALAQTPEATPVAVPSGQPVALVEVLLDDTPGALWARFRFVAPQIGTGGVGMDTSGPDMDHLCAEAALPYLAAHDIEPARVVISLSDRSVAFGASDPEATQFFELYRVENGACIWEAF